jgi:hypothetical protein
LRILGISLAVTNLVLFFSLPALCAFVDHLTGRRMNPGNPHIGYGVQELLVYFDPLLAGYVFPAVYTIGLALIPFLLTRTEAGTETTCGRTCAVGISLLLIGLKAGWLTLIAVEVFLRGPNWNLFWPWEVWDETRVVPLNLLNFSEFFWRRWMGRPTGGMSWAVRELPGVVLLSGYLMSAFGLAYGLSRWGSRAIPYWQWLLAVLLLQIAALVPIKMACRWAFALKYWIAIPEYFWNV